MDVAGFPHQVGGHFGLLKCAGHVLKPLNNRELAFYKAIDARLAGFTVKYCGRIRVNLRGCDDGQLALSTDAAVECHNLEAPLAPGLPDAHQHESASSSTASSEASCSDDGAEQPPMTFRVKKGGKVEAEMAVNTWAGQCQSKVVEKLYKGYDRWFIMLEDVVSGFRKPCVIDLKMGQRQYGDDSSAQKKLSQTQKCRASTSEELGVRMVGMQLYDRTTKTYSFVNKYEGRRMDKTKLHASLETFFVAAGIRRTKRLLTKLHELRVVLAAAESFRFFSSSLLISFDGAISDPIESVEPAPIVPEIDSEDTNDSTHSHDQPRDSISVKMIDFAHSTFDGFLEDKLYPGADEGYLLGVDSLIAILEQILSTSTLFHCEATSMPDLGIKKQRSLKRPYTTPPCEAIPPPPPVVPSSF
uniref:Kinase n=1 Tax=Panagrellus redivivus TaxID=6233 RepID=A0A7E4WCZ3_PANRE